MTRMDVYEIILQELYLFETNTKPDPEEIADAIVERLLEEGLFNDDSEELDSILDETEAKDSWFQMAEPPPDFGEEE